MLSDWDARLIDPERALWLAGDWPFALDVQLAELSQFEGEAGGSIQPDQRQANLRCLAVAHNHPDRVCDQSIIMLARQGDGMRQAATNTSVGDLLSAVLRHMVMAHDVPLNGGSASGR